MTRSPASKRPHVFAGAVALALAILSGACSSPAPSASTATPQATTTPEPTEADTAAIIAAFLELVGDPGLTMHVVADGTVTAFGGGQEQEVILQMAMDVSGEDGVGEATLDTGPSNVTFEMLILDGRAYVEDNGNWTRLPDYEQTTPLNPFVTLTRPEDVEYVAAEERDGESVHRLTTDLWIGADLSVMEDAGWRSVELGATETVIVVDDAGAPISMDFTGSMSGTFQRTPASVEFDVSYEFSDVGDPVNIPEP